MSRPPRFFISPDQVHGLEIMLTGPDAHHIRTVLRMKQGELLILSDEQGKEYAVKITEIRTSGIRTEIMSTSMREIPYPRITLGQGLPKSDKMDWIVQKATELGVAVIVPLITERTIVKVRDEEKRIARWQKICREASMQSNRPDIPRVEPIRQFGEYIESFQAAPDTLPVIAWEEGTEPLKNVLRQKQPVKNIASLIGPEGGFSAKEADSAKGKGFHAVTLGPNILRTETAAIALLSMILYETSANNCRTTQKD